MRARIIAVLILILLIGIPVWAYYYLTTREIASLSISAWTGSVFSVRLLGSWGIDGLPLADRALSYSQDCITECRISPILPARYTLTLTSSGSITLRDDISIDTGNELYRAYTLIRDISFNRIDSPDLSSVASWSTWHIRTETGSSIGDGENRIEDIRFTDAIDLSSGIRLGYIDQKDTKKLSLANLPLGQSILVRLDRNTGESSIVRTGMDIWAFILYRGLPAYMDSRWGIFAIRD